MIKWFLNLFRRKKKLTNEEFIKMFQDQLRCAIEKGDFKKKEEHGSWDANGSPVGREI